MTSASYRTYNFDGVQVTTSYLRSYVRKVRRKLWLNSQDLNFAENGISGSGYAGI